MSVATLLKNSWSILWRTRLIWIFAFIAFIIGVLDHFIIIGPSEILVLGSVLVVWLINLYAEAGTIYTAGRALVSQPVTFLETQRVIGKSFLRILVLAIIPILINPILSSMIIATVIRLEPARSGFYGIDSALALIDILFVFIAALVYPFIFFCYSGVVLHNGSLFGSLRRGWRIYLRTLGISLRVALLFLAFSLALRCVVTGIMLLFPNFFPSGHNLIQIIGGNGLLLIDYLIKSKAGEIARLVFATLLLEPLLRIMLANIYLNALGQVPAPGQNDAASSVSE
jgi:hypothetical protein